jgi:hypothetical protein
MTTQAALDVFDILQDKYGSPDVVASEGVSLLNMATNEYLNRLLPDSQGGLVNAEFDSNTLALVKPLVWAFNVSYTTIASGFLTNATLNGALQTASGDGTTTVFRYLDAYYNDGTNDWPLKFLKHNNRSAFMKNTFKKPTIGKRVYYQLLSNGIRIQPTSGYVAGTFNFSVVKTPAILDLVGNDPELDDYAMYNVIAIALKLAGVATRDEEILTDIRNTQVQIAQ